MDTTTVQHEKFFTTFKNRNISRVWTFPDGLFLFFFFFYTNTATQCSSTGVWFLIIIQAHQLCAIRCSFSSQLQSLVWEPMLLRSWSIPLWRRLLPASVSGTSCQGVSLGLLSGGGLNSGQKMEERGVDAWWQICVVCWKDSLGFSMWTLSGTRTHESCILWTLWRMKVRAGWAGVGLGKGGRWEGRSS